MAVKVPYRFQMYMEDELRDDLREIAHDERTSMNKLVHDVLHAFVQDKKATRGDQASRRERQPA